MPTHIHKEDNNAALVTENLGKIDFPVTGKSYALKDFQKGVLLLHNFEYPSARFYFQAAQEKDPDFVMAYWGEAMTYNHTLWAEKDLKAGRAVLNRLGPSDEARVQKAKNSIEKGFVQAVNLLFGNGNKIDQDNSYAKAMQALYVKYPFHNEVASFYSLALLGTANGERDISTYMKAAAISEEVYERNQKHPGALHYIIHAYDDPIHAPLGLRAARLYSQVAANASHALHMPSHIFLALGLWDEVIKSNKTAWGIGLKQNPTQDPHKYTIHDLHALSWLSYGYLQKKEYEKSYFLVKKMGNIALKTNTPMTKWYYAMMRSAYLSDSGNWKEGLPIIKDMKGIEFSAVSNDVYSNVMKILHSGKEDALQIAKAEIEKFEKSIPATVTGESHSDYFVSTTSSSITTAKIILLELMAQIKLMKKDNKGALVYLEKAMKLEDKTPFGYGPPSPVKPSFELAGDILVAEHLYVQAKNIYLKAKIRAPNRYIPGYEKLHKLLNDRKATGLTSGPPRLGL